MGFSSSSGMVGFSNSNVNLKATGETLVFRTIDKTKLFFPYRIRVYTPNAAGIITPPTLSIGTNASTYNNILVATSVALTTAGTFIDYAVSFPTVPLAQDVDVFVNVTVAATGTTLGARIAVFGDSF